MSIDLEIVLMKELVILINESIQRHQAAERVQDRPAAWVALGEIVMCQHMLQFYLDLEDDGEQYFDFLSATESALEHQRSIYKEARLAKDWHTALLALGRIRLVKSLFGRLSDVNRQMMHMIPTEQLGTMH